MAALPLACSRIPPATQAMLKFGHEVDDRGMGKTKQKNVFYVGFFFIFFYLFWALTNQICQIN